MKAKDFPHHKASPVAFPPGFLALAETSFDKTLLGVIPDKNGNCKWVHAMKGQRTYLVDTVTVPIAQIERKATQRLWLRHLRLVQLKTAKGIETEIGVSPRTWQGWEGGKAMPYFRAAQLAFMVWERTVCEQRERDNTRNNIRGHSC